MTRFASQLSRAALSTIVAVGLVGCSQTPVPTELKISPHEVELTPETFEELVHADTPVLVDFSAAWCGPCQEVKPQVERLAADREGSLVVAIADMTERDAVANPIAEAWNVSGYPTFVLVRNGQELGRAIGAPANLAEWVDSHL